MNIASIKSLKIDHKKLAEARREKGLSQSEVARELGFDRRQIWQYENGVALPLESFSKLAVYYGKPIEFFILA